MVTLTEDEYTLLMLAAQGQSIMSIGRWEPSCEHLVELGFLRRGDKFNNFITDEGRIAMEHHQDEVDTGFAKALINVHNEHLRFTKPHSVGPAIVQGKLFFGFPDGSSISCECIGEPYASQIVEMWRNNNAQKRA